MKETADCPMCRGNGGEPLYHCESCECEDPCENCGGSGEIEIDVPEEDPA